MNSILSGPPRSPQYAGEFENGGFTENSSNVSRLRYVRGHKKRDNHPPFWILILEKLGQEIDSRDYRDVIVFEKLRFQNVFRPHENGKPAFSNSSGFESVFEKLRFRGGVVWTVLGLTGDIKLLGSWRLLLLCRYNSFQTEL